MSEPILALKAGRAFRREGTNFVDSNPVKGAIILVNDDGLLHFQWKNRLTNEIEDDLILFPEDASFSKVTQPAGSRMYVLKFSSSGQRHFFWMQDASPARDEEFANNINALLHNPEYSPNWSDPATGSQPQASSSTSQPSASAASSAPIPQATPEQLAQLRELVSVISRNSTAPAQPDISLLDVLTPETLTALFRTHPDLIPALFPHLPPDLPIPPSAEVLRRIIASQQFQYAVSCFDQALHAGQLGSLVRGLGLPEEAGTGVVPFLRAVQDQARSERGGGGSSGNSDTPAEDHMETD